MTRRIAILLLALIAFLTACAAPEPHRALQPLRGPASPLRILAVGDSITAAGQWQLELGRLLDEAGIPHVIVTEALTGSRCNHWPPLIGGILAADKPNLMILYCGTNDDPAELSYGEPSTGWALRYLVEAAHAQGVAVLPSLIGYSDLSMAPPWLLTNEPRINDILWPQIARYWGISPPWLVGIANIQVMPGTAEYLDGDSPCDPASGTCGIHQNAKGYRTVGRLFYDAAAAGMGWPPATSMGEPPLCGMAGHRDRGTRPAYTPCP